MHSHMRSCSASPSQSTTTSSESASSNGSATARSSPSCQNSARGSPRASSSGERPPVTTNLNLNCELCGRPTVQLQVFVSTRYSIGTPSAPSHAPSSGKSPHTTTPSPNCGCTFTEKRTGTKAGATRFSEAAELPPRPASALASRPPPPEDTLLLRRATPTSPASPPRVCPEKPWTSSYCATSYLSKRKS